MYNSGTKLKAESLTFKTEMNRNHSKLCAHIFLLIALWQLALAVPSSNTEKSLKADFIDEVLTIRNFYIDDDLVYDANGSVIKGGTVGPWNIAQIEVEKLKLSSNKLVLEGHRVKYVKIKVLATIHLRDRIKIEIHFSPGVSSEQDLRNLLAIVFLNKTDNLESMVPEPWKMILHEQNASLALQDTAVTLGNGVIPPKSIYAPGPEYSDYALEQHIDGTVALSLIVDVDGRAKNIHVVKPAGYGLDKKAIEAVKRWRFRPATKDGQPVAVPIRVEVGFHLY